MLICTQSIVEEDSNERKIQLLQFSFTKTTKCQNIFKMS